ncbi:uncharacterized protein LOC131853897 isoform X2 [Achroia grisella]|uniref:uncharacterized protein LOC131853897 isoform X2 n=1 Tax=Achroia grisella TaxID=688607 RepID=UPI0027D34FC2|nr:uncharacterized protein LOC131853897 isoform X2 [Achroia grisella]
MRIIYANMYLTAYLLIGIYFAFLGFGTILYIMAMTVPDKYTLQYKMRLYGFDNDTTMSCNINNCNSCNQCQYDTNYTRLLVKPYKGDYERFSDNEGEKNFYYVPNYNSRFVYLGYVMVHVDLNHKIINHVRRQNSIGSISMNITLTEAEKNTKLYCFSLSCTFKEANVFECFRKLDVVYKFVQNESQPLTTEAPLQTNTRIDIKKKSRVHYTCANIQNSGSSVHLSQYFNYGTYAEMFNYTTDKYPIHLKMYLGEFDNNTALSCTLSQTGDDVGQTITKNDIIVVTSDNITTNVDVEDIYYAENQEIELNCVNCYFIEIKENNTMPHVVKSSEVNSTVLLKRSDNNTMLYCITITCKVISERNKCLRTFKKIRFIINENPLKNKPSKGGIIAGCIVSLAIISIIARIIYQRMRDYKIKQRNKSRPLPTIPLPREPVPYHHYEVIDKRFA